ncbi:MAG: glycosyltransferase [Alphaproteobacteria bacterium]|nr:glycosyltransferase [Alphaproteobacteria bacterium]
MDKRGTFDIVRPLRKLSAHIAETGPDIVYSFLGFSNFAAALAMPSRSPSRLLWGARVSQRPGFSYGPYGALIDFAETRLIRHPDLIIANSRAAHDWMARRGATPEKCRVVRNGFEPSRFVIDPDRRARQRSDWGVQGGQPVIGIVARFDPMKDHGTFFKAVSRLTAERADLRVAVVGHAPGKAGAEVARLADLNGLSEEVIWCTSGHDRITDIYNALDALCLTSVHSEGFPNVLAEAMRCGLGCVASDVGDARYIVGELGHVVPSRDPEACAGAIDRALTQGFDAGLSAARRSRIIEMFSAEAMIDQTEASLIELVGAQDMADRGLIRAH